MGKPGNDGTMSYAMIDWMAPSLLQRDREIDAIHARQRDGAERRNRPLPRRFFQRLSMRITGNRITPQQHHTIIYPTIAPRAARGTLPFHSPFSSILNHTVNSHCPNMSKIHVAIIGTVIQFYNPSLGLNTNTPYPRRRRRRQGIHLTACLLQHP